TGVPSGVGMLAGGLYYLPLRKDALTREPGICVIDLGKGRVVARMRSRKGDLPGNLVFSREHVFSLTPTHVKAYPQLAVERKRIEQRLAENANDPEGRLRRASLRMDQGDFPGAIEDLHVVLAQKKLDAEWAGKARTRLCETLEEYL